MVVEVDEVVGVVVGRDEAQPTANTAAAARDAARRTRPWIRAVAAGTPALSVTALCIRTTLLSRKRTGQSRWSQFRPALVRPSSSGEAPRTRVCLGHLQ